MNQKVLTYSLVSLLTSTTIAAFSIIDSAKGNDRTPINTSPMLGGMNMSADVDKSFIEMMIPHHQSGIEMAQMALSRAKSPEIKKLAQSIISAQTREIQQMQIWYKQWYGKDVPENVMNRGMGTGMNMDMNRGMGTGMNMDMSEAMKTCMQQQNMEMTTGLQNAPDFDQEFLRQMTSHHRMATMMSGMVANSGRHTEVRNLAQSIVKSQSTEIAQMQQLLQGMNTQTPTGMIK
jgi:uncharacterized protein (DUF305 family)